ncbi:MAG: GNAT family N-acetyltransferase [Hyphomicrobiaceae bacterium]
MPRLPFANGLVRKLWSTEAHRLETHLLRLDREARAMRFGHGVSETFIKDYASRLPDPYYIVFAYVEDGAVRGVAELRMLEQSWSCDAEAAFSVERPWREQGIGTELMGHVLRAARNRNVTQLHMACVTENRTMQHIAQKHEAQLRYEYGTVTGDIIPDGPSISSLTDEAIADTRGFVMAVLDLQTTLFKAA